MPKPVTLWLRIRTSLWFIPALCSAAAVGLAFVSVWLDRISLLGPVKGFWFLFETGAEGARGVLSTIAGSIMTVTGVVFSITIVVLQLASSQFTPRVLRTFTEDRANQLVMGTFIGTFIYSLLVMRSVRSAAEDYSRFVPSISVTVAVLLALLSIAVLIFFIHHIANSIRVEVILERVTHDALEVVHDLFPAELAEPLPTQSVAEDWNVSDDDVAIITARRGGYVQSINEGPLDSLAQKRALTVVMKRAVGDFVIPGDELAHVSPAVDGDVATAVQNAFAIGPERTRYQDVERGLIELADIGLRALSPSMNDPSTAIVCIDRITEVLTRLGTRQFPAPTRLSASGALRIKVMAPEFDELVRLSYRELRHHGAGDPAVAIRLAMSIGRVAARVPAARRPALMVELRELGDVAAQSLKSEQDRERVRQMIEQIVNGRTGRITM